MSAFTCRDCGRIYAVPSLARDCELRHLEHREGDRPEAVDS